MVSRFTKHMRAPRNARPLCGTDEGWWYVDPSSISVHGRVTNMGGCHTTSVRLTRRQLERALEIMDEARA